MSNLELGKFNFVAAKETIIILVLQRWHKTLQLLKEIWLHHSLINPLKPEKDGKNNEFCLQGEGKYDLEY